MLPSTTCLSDTLLQLNSVIGEAEELLHVGQKEQAVELIMSTSESFVSILSQFDEGYFSNKELEQIEAYDIILNICRTAASPNNEYDPHVDDEGDEIYEW
jgi:arginine decarboxylase-like protein